MALYLIPLTFLLLLSLWMWALIDALRRERDYLWLILVVFIPPLGVALYLVNFLILGDEERGLTAFRRRIDRERRIFELKQQIREEDFPARREELARLLFESGQWRDCLTHLEKALDIDPENLRAQYMAGRCLAELDEYDKALAHLDYVFHEEPAYDHYRAGILYARVLEAAARRQEALKVFERLRERTTTPEIRVRHALVLTRENQNDKAREELESLLADYRDESENIHAARDKPWLDTARKLLSRLTG